MKPEKAQLVQKLSGLLRAHPETRDLDVRAHGAHLIVARNEVFVRGATAERDDRVRLTHIRDDDFGISVKRHTGRWEQTPFHGPMPEMVDLMRGVMPHVLASVGHPS